MPAKESRKATQNDLLDPKPSIDEPAREERKRYTTQLQRRAQAHITAELGGSTVARDTERQVTTVVQHAQQATSARRVSFYRPVERGRRWHVATMLADGSFYYGLASQDAMGWSRVVLEQRRSLVIDEGDAPPAGGPTLSELGMRSYIGVPVLSADRSVAVLEVVDIQERGTLEGFSTQLEETVSGIAQCLDDQSKQLEQASGQADSAEPELNADSVVDLVLRQPFEVDETFEVTPGEWAVLNFASGDSTVRAISEKSALPLSQVVSTSISLIERGLLRLGKEGRRRL